MQAVLRALRDGRTLVLDDALGPNVSASVLIETKRLLTMGALRGDTAHSAEPQILQRLRGVAPRDALRLYSRLIDTVYMRVPSLWDSYRLIAHLEPPPASEYPGLAASLAALDSLLSAISEAELQSHLSLSPAWPATGLRYDQAGALLVVSGFNGTRYTLHSDAAADPARK